MAEHPHVTLIRKGYKAFSAGDFGTLRELFASDAVQHQPGTSPMSGDFKGADAILEQYAALFRESEGTFNVELQQCFTDGAGHVIAVHRARASRKGKTLDVPEALSFTLVGDRVVDIAALERDIEELDAFWA